MTLYGGDSIVNVFSTLGNIDIDVTDIFEFQVGDGNKILFWLDDWLKNGTLAVKFPSLYALDKRKSCLLGDRWVNGVFSWAWKRKPNNSQELLEL
uniref:Reverse transcriptase zinc-binding domain-containing protein n=1 Tax=Lactuca sativa TaxID=4236 RepID=A0A9R1W3G2_LACSA|nr:hypothetical protein LSAT_V11C300147860 [Lactuca sativa]